MNTALLFLLIILVLTGNIFSLRRLRTIEKRLAPAQEGVAPSQADRALDYRTPPPRLREQDDPSASTSPEMIWQELRLDQQVEMLGYGVTGTHGPAKYCGRCSRDLSSNTYGLPGVLVVTGTPRTKDKHEVGTFCARCGYRTYAGYNYQDERNLEEIVYAEAIRQGRIEPAPEATPAPQPKELPKLRAVNEA